MRTLTEIRGSVRKGMMILILPINGILDTNDLMECARQEINFPSFYDSEGEIKCRAAESSTSYRVCTSKPNIRFFISCLLYVVCTFFCMENLH